MSIQREKDIFFSTSREETERIAKQTANKLQGGETLLLSGELGAGKTTFTKALFKELGVQDTVTSPTFTIMKNYSGKDHRCHHMDMYRIETEEEADEMGLWDEIGDDDITVIEWNKFTSFPGKVISVDILYSGENQRKIRIKGIEL